MNALITITLLCALFVVAALLLIRPGERVLALGVAALSLLAGALLAFSGSVERAQGLLVCALALSGGAALMLGGDRSARPVNVARTSAPKRPTNVTQQRYATKAPTMTDLKFADYDVLDRIGIGGMGSVYRARRKQDGRTVALKVPQEKYLADAKFVKRFYREAEVLKRFNHPNIVRVYDYRSQGDEYYIAMEFLDGESLETVLENKQLSFGETVQIIRSLADALRHIHTQNVVHRDIKPANVMVMRGALHDGKLREGGVKLMDFGIAVGKVLTRLTMTGARVGTPIYMAPEQAKGNRVDARSDVYSLGLLAYEMVTGQTAFRGSYEAVVHQQIFESPKPPKQVRLEVPGKLNDLVLSMIEKDPALRPTLDDVIGRLDAGVLSDETFDDPYALAMSVQEKRGTLRVLDLKGKLRLSLRDLSGEQALPSAPNALTGDEDGNIYLCLQEFRQGKSGALIRKIAPDGRELLAFGAYGLGENELLQPVSMTLAGDLLFVLDGESHHVVVFDKAGRYQRRFGGRGRGLGRFEKPRSIAATPQGHIYVLDSGNREVQRFTTQGEYVSRYAFRMDRTSDELRPLHGLGVDGRGTVYIVDGVADKVRKIEADGTPGNTFSLESLVGESSDAPWLMQVSAEGLLYAVKQGGQVLRTYSTVGDLLSSNDMYAPVQAIALVNRPPA
ncbi:6-bladed beta-propeller [Deinococcus irradiatisoli]|uniref:non-specific serine/threonine protein kinase n=1 Tax=Deinococcus irradiatisoli TaxID=2202254 RepID=A0A2Z3JC63_9DEIO|nr:protein kinase [Deinococcus irradiatisoli]AWN22622.1 6-bladed beta-propeller [Deinococcus irradiatisoli]